MPRMIPPRPREGSNASERQLFSALEAIMDRPDWTVIHSLSLGQNFAALAGESDFIVIAPGQGILVIEAKSPKWAEYKGGDWYLDRTPKPTKDPLKQLDAARRSIRGFLRERDLLVGDEPIARLLWFTSLGRHQFENKTVGDMQFFEWELGLHDDLAKPARLIDKVFAEYVTHFSQVPEVKVNAASLTVERAAAIADALVSDFGAHRTKADDKRDRLIDESHLIEEQLFALELVETNEHVYFDGPAGTGKSILLATAARRLAKQGKRTFVACWNILMADELRDMVSRPDVEVADLNSFMLQVCGLTSNPADAANDWYQRELPELALDQLKTRPHLGAFEAICVDEFQDIAGNELLVDVILAAAGTGGADGTTLVFAGDQRQQILKPQSSTVDAFASIKKRIPDLVRAQIRRNCRIAPGLIVGAEKHAHQSFDFSGHRMARGVPSAFEVTVGDGTTDLVAALKSLLEHHEPEDIVILSPFGERNSLVGSFLARAEKTQDERWLRKQLALDGSSGKIRWRSIFKFKGGEAEAAVLTDLGERGREFVETSGVRWDDLLYVGLTRAKYRCVVLGDSAVIGGPR